MSDLEENLLFQIKAVKLPTPEREYIFAKPRRFRADFAWPDQMLLVECEGGIWVNGRHNRPSGFAMDAEKDNLAAEKGWTVLRYTAGMIRTGAAIDQIKRVLG